MEKIDRRHTRQDGTQKLVEEARQEIWDKLDEIVAWINEQKVREASDAINKVQKQVTPAGGEIKEPETMKKAYFNGGTDMNCGHLDYRYIFSGYFKTKPEALEWLHKQLSKLEKFEGFTNGNT